MAELTSITPCAGILPLTIGSVTLTEEAPEAITSIAPLKGQTDAVSAMLKDTVGAAFPAPNKATGKAGARAVWSGQGQALVLGPSPDPITGAAMTDQSDAWAVMTLEGAAAREVLARLVPLDLRPDAFKTGHAARTLLGHMMAVLFRTGADRYTVMVFRSMAATAVHDFKTAMEAVAARG